MEKDIQKTIEMYKGALSECQLWKTSIDIGLTLPEWRKRNFTKKKDIEDMRKLRKAYEEVELYLQNKLK